MPAFDVFYLAHAHQNNALGDIHGNEAGSD